MLALSRDIPSPEAHWILWMAKSQNCRGDRGVNGHVAFGSVSTRSTPRQSKTTYRNVRLHTLWLDCTGRERARVHIVEVASSIVGTCHELLKREMLKRDTSVVLRNMPQRCH